MTHPLIEALENTLERHNTQTWKAGDAAALRTAIDLARSLITEVEQLREDKEALEWVVQRGIKYRQYMIDWAKDQEDCPPHLKALIEKMKEGK